MGSRQNGVERSDGNRTVVFEVQRGCWRGEIRRRRRRGVGLEYSNKVV